MDTNCEIVWCKLNIIGCRTLYLDSFYRPPNKIDAPNRQIWSWHSLYVEYDTKAKREKQASRKIYLYERVDTVGLKDHMAQFKDAYLSEDHSHMSVNDMWVKSITGFVEVVERFIPSKMTKKNIVCHGLMQQAACKKET